MTVIGLTGNSGTGKSSVAKVMEKYGALILDCDKIAHENMAVGGCAYDEIVSAFGKDILNSDKTINRKALGNIVFNDSQKYFEPNYSQQNYSKSKRRNCKG